MHSRMLATIALALSPLIGAATLRGSYIYNANDFATQVINYSGPIDPRPAYGDPTAILGRPALNFNNNAINPNVQDIHRAKIVEPLFNYGPGDISTRKAVTTVLPSGASVVVKMGRAIANDPAHPYRADLIVFGNSFYAGNDTNVLSDSTNLNAHTLTGEINAHAVDVAVSPDNTHWFTFPTLTSGLQPFNAFKWDRSGAAWTNEELNPTVPLNPSIYTTDFANRSAADVLDAYGNSAGGTALDLANAHDGLGLTLAQNGFTSIQYVRLASTDDDYAVISGVSAVSSAGGKRVLLKSAQVDPLFAPPPISNAVSRGVPEPNFIAIAAVIFPAVVRRRRTR